MTNVFGACAAITVLVQGLGFLAAYALQTEKFYDILGGLNFLFLGAFSAYAGQAASESDANGFETVPWSEDHRKVAATCVFSVSRTWLLIFLAWRAHERGGDARFDEVKDKFGMFLLYWTVQAVWVFCISMPVIFINGAITRVTEFSAFDWATIVGFAVGVVFEILADIQKAVWVKKGRPGCFCQSGVWKFSRHPNYFGEILQWWAVWMFAYGSGTGVGDFAWWSCILSPLFTMNILLNTGGTGIANANGKNLKRYYDQCPEQYARYRASTSILIPMIGYKYVPLWLKRTIFMDFERYEYRQNDETDKKEEPKSE